MSGVRHLAAVWGFFGASSLVWILNWPGSLSIGHFRGAAEAVPERPRTERIAFRTRSEIEILDDGYKWRKYGKKSVKNSPNPRYMFKWEQKAATIYTLLICSVCQFEYAKRKWMKRKNLRWIESLFGTAGRTDEPSNQSLITGTITGARRRAATSRRG